MTQLAETDSRVVDLVYQYIAMVGHIFIDLEHLIHNA